MEGREPIGRPGPGDRGVVAKDGAEPGGPTGRGCLEDVEAVLAELAAARRQGDLRPATTLFVGGGTPSLLGADRLARLLSAVDRAPGAEGTGCLL